MNSLYIKSTLTVIILFLFIVNTMQAQSIGLGLHINHLSNGVNASYTIDSKNKKWQYEAGIRTWIPNWDLAEGKGNMSYQQGAAYTFMERFSINLNVYRKLYEHRIFDIGLMSNMLISFESIISDPQIGWDDGIDSNFIGQTYQKASPSIELTIGPKFHINLTEKIQFFGMSGVGATYMHHKYSGYDILNNYSPVYIYFPGMSKYPFPGRGVHEYTVFIGAGFKYNISHLTQKE